jgi:hypothetical protein
MTDRRRDRGVSITVSHVMTVGITTILIAGLLLGAGNMLEDQRRSTGNQELRAIGDRIATELVTAADRGQRTNASVTIHSRQPSHSVGGGYQVHLNDISASDECFSRAGYDACLVLEANAENIEVEVPLSLPDGISVVNGTAQGGRVVVVYDNADAEVTIRGESP